MKKRKSLLKIFAIIMIIISLGFSFLGTNNTKYYTDEINQALKTNKISINFLLKIYKKAMGKFKNFNIIFF